MEYTINEIVEKLQIGSAGTLRQWENAINLQVPRNNKGHRRYTEYELSILTQVKDMREKDIDLNTISSKLNLTSKSDLAEEVVESPVLIEQLTNNLNLIKSEITQDLDTKFQNFMEISKMYGAMSHKVGSLEAQLEAEKNKLNLTSNQLTDKLNSLELDITRRNNESLELKDKLSLTSNQVVELNTKLHEKELSYIELTNKLNLTLNELEETKNKLKEAEKILSEYKNLSWYKKIFS